MTAYDFQPRFVDAILAGTKRQTVRKIRTGRSRHARPGEEVQLYTGRRTPASRLIGRATCDLVVDVKLRLVDHGRNEGVEWWAPKDPRFFCDKARLDRFARADGFANWADLKTFWSEHHPGVDEFDGVFIRWGDLL